MKIYKKCWPEYFSKIVDGSKKYDLRLADFKCKVGDILVFREWDPKTKNYTGREVEKEITHMSIFKIKDLVWSKEEIEKYGLQLFSLK